MQALISMLRVCNYGFLYSLICCLLFVSCGGTSLSANLRADAEIYFENPGSTNSTAQTTSIFRAQIAKTEQERSVGMMYRRQMDPDQAMLFVFEGMEPRVFWMKNTYISLDMIFVGQDGIVKNVIHSVPPLTETPRRSGVPCKFVLEIPAGQAQKHGIVVGSKMVTSPPL